MNTDRAPGTALLWLAQRPGICVGARQIVGLFADDIAAMEACRHAAAGDGSGPLDWEEAGDGWVARDRRFPGAAATAWTITRHEITGGLAALLAALPPADVAAAAAGLPEEHFGAVCDAIRLAEDIACFGEAEARALAAGRTPLPPAVPGPARVPQRAGDKVTVTISKALYLQLLGGLTAATGTLETIGDEAGADDMAALHRRAASAAGARPAVDHSKCPPEVHDYSLPDGCPEQASDGRGHLACNDCHALMFYCRADEDYRHAGPGTPPCFLLAEAGHDVAIPDGAATGRPGA